MMMETRNDAMGEFFERTAREAGSSFSDGRENICWYTGSIVQGSTISNSVRESKDSSRFGIEYTIDFLIGK
jgi:tRNA A37 threonylcarbamoyltransferase TsaD